MKVIGISGSPRKDGNTEILVKEALKPFYEKGWEVTEFFLSSKSIKPCIGCETCNETGTCAIEGDDMGFLISELENCDALIIGSPAYYRNVTAQLKALFDRSFVIKNRNLLAGKPGGAIAVGRGEGGGQSLVLSIIHNFYLSSGALCVPCEINGLSARADKPGDILKQEKRLRQARVLGENIIKYSEMICRS
ncbi:flavodoxin family protein [Lutispora thermophila]|uniref:Multimeric flavodoxin WrbA n=1 Tax=Lutispora thermophila DSM 19022 TaxID=1122184 RepID=A0A1M6IJH2_9FIRM|nr:flavodoxin family protein [Lutispora thermophila]SHJ34568.1 Multimeric flavodoxin WrbA [Lutispora thermophila DSM 19022]